MENEEKGEQQPPRWLRVSCGGHDDDDGVTVFKIEQDLLCQWCGTVRRMMESTQPSADEDDEDDEVLGLPPKFVTERAFSVLLRCMREGQCTTIWPHANFVPGRTRLAPHLVREVVRAANFLDYPEAVRAGCTLLAQHIRVGKYGPWQVADLLGLPRTAVDENLAEEYELINSILY